MAGRLRVTQIKSTISHVARNRATVRALGLRRVGDTVEVPDNDATRGMVRQVRFLVAVEEIGPGGTRAPEVNKTPSVDATPASVPGEPATAYSQAAAEEKE